MHAHRRTPTPPHTCSHTHAHTQAFTHTHCALNQRKISLVLQQHDSPLGRFVVCQEPPQNPPEKNITAIYPPDFMA